MSTKDLALRSSRLVKIPPAEWRGLMDDDGSAHGDGACVRLEVWLSSKFHVQVFNDGGHLRVTVGRVKRVLGRWRDGITWDELMQVKREIGHGYWCGVELFPPDSEVVNVANLRHLWLSRDCPSFMWRRER